MDAPTATITLAVAGAAGVVLTAVADRARIPSVVLALAGGIVLGPNMLGFVDPASLGPGIDTVVSLAVAVVLFEGGLSLDLAGFRTHPSVILRLLTLGVLTTWVGAALGAYFLFPRLGIELAALAGSLIVVSGPTVILPILRRIQVRSRLRHVLYWEGVLVDAVGAFAAVLCYEWIISTTARPWQPMTRFALRFGTGVLVGTWLGLTLRTAVRRRWFATRHNNILMLTVVLLASAISNQLLPESGILAAIVAGFVVGQRNGNQLTRIRRFGLELSEAAVGLLFVLLAANLDLAHFARRAASLTWFVVLVVMVLRPINVAISTYRGGFDWREKLFLSWVAPRGIVAASMASLFALRLSRVGYSQAWLVESLVYAVIATTVVVQGLSSPLVARLLELQPTRGMTLLIGDPVVSRHLQRELRKMGVWSIIASGDEHPRDPRRPSAFAEHLSDPRIGTVDCVLALSDVSAKNEEIRHAWEPVVGSRCLPWPDRGGGGRRRRQPRPWGPIPRLADVASALRTQTHVLEAIEIGTKPERTRFSPEFFPILALCDDQLVAITDDLPHDARWVLVVRRRVAGLAGLVRDATTVAEGTCSPANAIDILVRLAQRDQPELGPISAKALPTTIRGGVQITRLTDPHVTQKTAYMLSYHGDEPFVGPDGVSVRLVFLLVSTEDEQARGRAALDELVGDPALVATLAGAHARARLLSYVHERE